MIRKSYLACAAGLLLAVSACEQSTAPSTSLSQADANQLAADMDAVSTIGITNFGIGVSFSKGFDGTPSSAAVSAEPTSFTNSFGLTRSCPQGGSVEIVGTINGTGDRTTHSLTLDASATRTDKECAFQTRDGILTLTGNPDIDFTANVKIVNGALSGLQTATHKGSFKWARGGLSETCDIDLVSEFDPATHTATVKGEFCGMDVNVTRTRGS